MYGDAGLIDIIESEIVATGSLQGVVIGHHYNRAVRTLKIVLEALSRFQWQAFGDHLADTDAEGSDDSDLSLIQDQILGIREYLNKDTTKKVLLSENFKKLF